MRMLYREGDSQIIWDTIPCDYIVVPEGEVDTHVEQGWKVSPFDLYKQEENKDDANEDGELSLEEAKAFLDKAEVDYSGLHWKKVIALAKEKAGDK